jgi:hypothetical protein
MVDNPGNLTERAFRNIWDKTSGNERQRFEQIAAQLGHELVPAPVEEEPEPEPEPHRSLAHALRPRRAVPPQSVADARRGGRWEPQKGPSGRPGCRDTGRARNGRNWPSRGHREGSGSAIRLTVEPEPPNAGDRSAGKAILSSILPAKDQFTGWDAMRRAGRRHAIR